MWSWKFVVGVVFAFGLSLPASAATLEGNVERCHDPAGASFCILTPKGKRVTVAYEWQLEDVTFRRIEEALTNAEDMGARVKVTGPMADETAFDTTQLTKISVEVLPVQQPTKPVAPPATGAATTARMDGPAFGELVRSNPATVIAKFKRGASTFQIDGIVKDIKVERSEGTDIAVVRVGSDQYALNIGRKVALYCVMLPADAAKLSKGRKHQLEGHVHQVIDDEEANPFVVGGIEKISAVLAVDCKFR